MLLLTNHFGVYLDGEFATNVNNEFTPYFGPSAGKLS